MKHLVLTLIIFIGIIGSTAAQKHKIATLLDELSDVTYTEIENIEGFESTYILKVKQPLDHEDSTKGYFNQQVILSHKDFQSPTVIITQGYQLYGNRTSELTTMVNGNQINVEHRFFGESIPDSLNYHYLNLKQATADLHHIRQLFQSIYAEKWISTGVSKGGATTVFYRYFYPNDVDISVPYVAPINIAQEDPRIYKFLDTIGSNECRTKIQSFQIQLLENRDKIMPLLKENTSKSNLNFTIVPYKKAYEYAVMEYPFSFWQYGQSCDKIPNEEASFEDQAKYFNSISTIEFFSDESIIELMPHYYQSATEMGYYGYETYKFKDYLTELPTDRNPQATFFSFDMNDPFDESLLQDINTWLETTDEKFMYIYGSIDTWTADGVPEKDLENSEWFILEGKHHGNARIKNMNETDKNRFESIITNWLQEDKSFGK
jgi:hypothetical protein